MSGNVSFPGIRITEKIRSDPLADFYRGTQEPLGRPVLVKALPSSILPSSPFATRLEREAQLLAELDHPGVLRLFDFCRDKSRMWLVLEYVDGWNLSELLEAGGPMDPLAATAVMLEVSQALEHAHGRNVVHRQITPANILVSRTGEVKLIDFAMASEERFGSSPELIESSATFKSPSYLSPEQILGEAPDPRSDLFSLGVVYYELLTGVRPFDAPDERTSTQLTRHEAPPPLHRSISDLPAAIDRIVLRCLEKLPSDRFYSAEELSLALHSALDASGVSEPTPLIGRDLHRRGLIDQPPVDATEPRPVKRATPLAVGGSTAGAVQGLLALLGLIVIGSIGLQLWARRSGDVAPSARGSKRLELRPSRSGSLRVLAEPWAHIFIDGQKVATTPIAEPIPLRIGKHYVRLEHPNAPTERRTIEILRNETTRLDVQLEVIRPPKPVPSVDEQTVPEDGTP